MTVLTALISLGPSESGQALVAAVRTLTDALGLQLLNDAELDGQLTMEIAWTLPPAVAVHEMISTFRDWKARGEVDGVILFRDDQMVNPVSTGTKELERFCTSFDPD